MTPSSIHSTALPNTPLLSSSVSNRGSEDSESRQIPEATRPHQPSPDPEPTEVLHTTTDSESSHWTSSVSNTLGISVAIGLVSGTLYAFGRYSKDLKETLNISQGTLQQFGIWLDCGSAAGHPVVGYIYDRYGPTLSSFGAALVIFTSYSGIQAIVNNNSNVEEELSNASAWVLKVAFAGVGFGSALGYIGGLGSTAAAFASGKHASRAVACVSTGYGLSSILVGLSYRWLGGGNEGIDSFFGVWAGIVASVYLVASLMFRFQTPRIDDADAVVPTVERNQEILEVIEAEDPETFEDEGDFVSEAISPSATTTLPSSWNTWQRMQFWWLFLAFGCITGCGLLVINNLSTMAQSLGASDQFVGTLVVALSLSNASGRLLVGTLGDFVGKDYRIQLLQALEFVMALGLFASFVWADYTQVLVLTVVLALLTYGGSYVIVVSILTDLFGGENFGKDYGLIGMAPALSGWAFNTLGAKLYERQNHNDDGNVCLGPECYRTTYLLTGLAALLGCLALWPVSRNKNA